jgi:hypothetical protein
LPAKPFGGGESDALNALDMAGGGAAAKAPAAPPRIMEVADATAWSGQGRIQEQEGRHRNTKMVFGLVSVVCVIIVVVGLSMTKKAPPAVVAAPVKPVLGSEALPNLGEEDKVQPPKPPEVAPKEEPALDPKGKGKLKGPLRGRIGLRGGPAPGPGPTTPGPTDTPTPPTGTTPPVAQGDGRRERLAPAVAPTVRPPPSQGEITRVIANNKAAIKTCYQRALLRDSSLTHGKIVVGVTIGLSGRVKGVRVDGPASFRSLEPCIKEMVGRWSFPQASEEYGTEFSYLFQGNE